MKKLISIILTAILATTLFATAAFAADARWTNVVAITPSISASSGEYASVIRGVSGTTKIKYSLTLYEKGSTGAYREVSSTSGTYYGQQYRATGSYSITKGKTYKLVTAATVTCNGTNEDVSYTYEKKC